MAEKIDDKIHQDLSDIVGIIVNVFYILGIVIAIFVLLMLIFDQLQIFAIILAVIVAIVFFGSAKLISIRNEKIINVLESRKKEIMVKVLQSLKKQ